MFIQLTSSSELQNCDLEAKRSLAQPARPKLIFSKIARCTSCEYVTSRYPVIRRNSLFTLRHTFTFTSSLSILQTLFHQTPSAGNTFLNKSAVLVRSLVIFLYIYIKAQLLNSKYATFLTLIKTAKVIQKVIGLRYYAMLLL